MSPATWNEVKAKAKAVRDLPPEQEAARQAGIDAGVVALRAEARAHRLAEIRKERDLTQVQVAEAMGVGQNRVSDIERGELGVAGLDTLRRYIEALGGRLDVVADFGDVRLRVG